MEIVKTFIVQVYDRYVKLYQTVSQNGTPEFFIERMNINGIFEIEKPTSKELDQIKFI